MDPKSLDHLDPKLKETYARVMGTNVGASDTGQNAAAPAAPSDPNALSVTPGAPIADPNQLSASPGVTTPDAAAGLSTPDTAAPPNSSFFSNPSPAATPPPQPQAGNDLSAPIQPAAPEAAPVTPYTPEDANNQAAAPFSQPLPSPSTVNQGAPHEASSLLKVLYIVGAVLFFAIYTIFWIKVFNLPFLF